MVDSEVVLFSMVVSFMTQVLCITMVGKVHTRASTKETSRTAGLFFQATLEEHIVVMETFCEMYE